MTDVVLIPAYRRPEFLLHCLHNIKQAYGAETLHYILRFDAGYSPDLFHALEDFQFSHEVTYTQPTRYTSTKQSYSLLTGYLYAAQRNPDGLVYMIEEDVMIARDFFDCLARVHAQNTDLFSAHGDRNQNRVITRGGDHNEYYLTTQDYGSIGVCFKAKTILEHIQPHANGDYYMKPDQYIKVHFPGAPFHPGHTEQDGLIRRIQWKLENENPGHHMIAFPYQPRCYHAGFYGKNRLRVNYPGPLEKRVQMVNDVIYSDAQMRTFALQPAYYQDSVPIELNQTTCSTMQLKPLDLALNPRR